MENVFAVLRVLGNIMERILRDGSVETVEIVRAIMRRIRIATWMAIAWPFILLAIAMPGNEWKYWPVHYIVLAVTIIILLAFLWMATGMGPLTILTAEVAFSPKIPFVGRFVEKARKATNALRIVLFFELIAGIYFAWIPIANNPALALTQILIVAAIVCVVGIKGWKPIVVVLVAAFCIVTVIFFFSARTVDPSAKEISPQGRSLTINLNFGDRKNTGADPQTKNIPPAEQPDIPKPLAPARPTANNLAPAPLDSSEANDEEGAQRKESAAPTSSIRWFKPTSGDEGGYIVRISSARYVAAGKVGFRLYVQPTRGLESESLYLGDSGGEDNQGNFNVWLAGITGNYIRCTDTYYPCKMFPGMPTYIDVEVDRPSGVNTLAFQLRIAPGGGSWIEYDFIQIPVDIN